VKLRPGRSAPPSAGGSAAEATVPAGPDRRRAATATAK
jgi:hypothetical protein